MDYLKYIVDEIHSVVFATVDGSGRASFRLHLDDLYFFTEYIFSVLGNPFIHTLRHR